MQKSDLKQIKQVVDTSVKHAINTSVKQIIDESLDKKLDQKFKENNKKIFKRIESKIDSAEERIMTSTQKEFHDVNEKLDGIDKTLENKADKSTLLNWADKRILNLELDRNKAKYFHIKEWKDLPSAQKINSTLIKEGVK
jgi:uncharacterized protein YicC (UPF0701 family)